MTTTLHVDAAALRDNARRARAALPADAGLLAALKADAYGLGIGRVARALAGCVDGACVGCICEARAAREAGITGPLLVLGPFRPARVAAARALSAALAVGSREDLAAARAAASGNAEGPPLKVHLEVDVGLGRFGFAPADAAAAARALRDAPGLLLEGLFAQPSDPARYSEEAESFDAAARSIEPGEVPPLLHFGNSNLVLRRPGLVRGCARVGDLLHGVRPSGGSSSPNGLPSGFPYRLVATLTAPLVALRDLPALARPGYDGPPLAHPARVGIVSAGYAAGLLRILLPAGAPVIVRGRRAPLLAPPLMNELIVDLSGHPDARPGDPATLLGGDADARIDLAGYADRLGASEAEALVQLCGRAERD